MFFSATPLRMSLPPPDCRFSSCCRAADVSSYAATLRDFCSLPLFFIITLRAAHQLPPYAIDMLIICAAAMLAILMPLLLYAAVDAMKALLLIRYAFSDAACCHVVVKRH